MTELTESGTPIADEHFQDYETQSRSVRLGMWVFLGSETLLFAGLFALYAAYRSMYTASFTDAVHHNNAVLGTVMTVLLLISSFSVAWSLHAIQLGHRRASLISLIVTLSLGAVFLSMKIYEYLQHFAEGIYPGIHYHNEAMPEYGAKMFFTLYYFMTGLHALHVIAGMVILGIMAVMVAGRRITPERSLPLEMAALYWHLVDMVWIFLWPLLYLVG